MRDASAVLPPSVATDSTLGFASSGTSPGAAPRVHLLGAGKVGRAFLEQVQGAGLRVVAVSDSGATVHARDGLDPARVVRHKAAGGALRDLPGAEPLPELLALRLVPGDVVVDATATAARTGEGALQRARLILREGRSLACAAKDALALGAAELLALAPGRLGVDAALGGTGRRLLAERAALAAHTRALTLVANVSTTVILGALERGASLAEALDGARRQGYLEGDPTLDLDGSDAACKLAIVVGLLFGVANDPATIAREDLRHLDLERVRWRARHGRTTRLVAEAERGGPLRVHYAELARTSPLAAPPDRVLYGYDQGRGQLRLHVGLGVGPRATAAALLEDVRRLARQEVAP